MRLPCVMCGKEVMAMRKYETIFYCGDLYACHSTRRDCDGGRGSYAPAEKRKRLDKMSAAEKERSRLVDQMPPGSTEPGSPEGEELAARLLGELLKEFPNRAYELGKDRLHLMWDGDHIDRHRDEPLFRDRSAFRELGRELDRNGGLELMRRVAHRATEVGPYGDSPVPWVTRHVERLWDGIGDWRSGTATPRESSLPSGATTLLIMVEHEVDPMVRSLVKRGMPAGVIGKEAGVGDLQYLVIRGGGSAKRPKIQISESQTRTETTGAGVRECDMCQTRWKSVHGELRDSAELDKFHALGDVTVYASAEGVIGLTCTGCRRSRCLQHFAQPLTATTDLKRDFKCPLCGEPLSWG
jgi:hypothetical protein